MSVAAQPWGIVEFVVHYVYLSTMIVNGVLFLYLPQESLPYASYRVIFAGLVVLAALTAPITYYVYRRYVSVKALEHIRRTTGEGASASAFKLGIILVTCLGDFSGVAGASFFTFTRDPYGLLVFLGGWAVQYALTILWVANGKQFLRSA